MCSNFKQFIALLFAATLTPDYEGLCPWRHMGAELQLGCWCSMELELSAMSPGQHRALSAETEKLHIVREHGGEQILHVSHSSSICLALSFRAQRAPSPEKVASVGKEKRRQTSPPGLWCLTTGCFSTLRTEPATVLVSQDCYIGFLVQNKHTVVLMRISVARPKPS